MQGLMHMTTTAAAKILATKTGSVCQRKGCATLTRIKDCVRTDTQAGKDAYRQGQRRVVGKGGDE